MVPTVFVPVQAAEHYLQLFFMRTEIPRELLKVQSSIVVGVPVLHDLEPRQQASHVVGAAPVEADPRQYSSAYLAHKATKTQ